MVTLLNISFHYSGLHITKTTIQSTKCRKINVQSQQKWLGMRRRTKIVREHRQTGGMVTGSGQYSGKGLDRTTVVWMGIKWWRWVQNILPCHPLLYSQKIMRWLSFQRLWAQMSAAVAFCWQSVERIWCSIVECTWVTTMTLVMFLFFSSSVNIMQCVVWLLVVHVVVVGGMCNV